MSHQFKQAIQLFQTAEQKMLDYAVKIEQLQQLIKQRLEKGTPLPEGARVTLHSPDDESFLANALTQWNQGKKTSLSSAEAIVTYLSEYDISMAKHTITNWSNKINRVMERILNQSYQTSDILPPPHLYLAETDDELALLFPLYEPNSLNALTKMTFINYLKSTGNPWEAYRKEREARHAHLSTTD